MGLPMQMAATPPLLSYPPQPAEWEDVVSVKVFLLLSSTSNAPGLADGKTYSYADKAGITFSDSKKRRLFSGVARLTNVSIKRSRRMNKQPLVGVCFFRSSAAAGRGFDCRADDAAGDDRLSASPPSPRPILVCSLCRASSASRKPARRPRTRLTICSVISTITLITVVIWMAMVISHSHSPLTSPTVWRSPSIACNVCCSPHLPVVHCWRVAPHPVIQSITGRPM